MLPKILVLSLLVADAFAGSPLHSAFRSNTTDYSVMVGVTEIKLTHEEFKTPSSIVMSGRAMDSATGYAFLNLHENENTSVVAARSFLLTHGGSLVKFNNGHSRLISFRLEQGGAVFSVDPNRMFTEEGIAASLKTYGIVSSAVLSARRPSYLLSCHVLGPYSDDAVVEVQKLADQVQWANYLHII